MAETKKCNDCGHTKPVTEFNNKSGGGKHYLQAQCRTCDNNRARVVMQKFNPRGNAISHVMGSRMRAQGIPTGDHYHAEHSALRKSLRKEIFADGSWQTGANTETKPQAPRKARVIPQFSWVAVNKTRQLNETAIMKVIRKELTDIYGGCEFTGEVPEISQVCHIYYRKFARLNGDLETIRDLDNCIFAIGDINLAMEYYGHYLGDEGDLLVLPNYDRLLTLEVLGVYDTRIEMTPARCAYTYRAHQELGVILT